MPSPPQALSFRGRSTRALSRPRSQLRQPLRNLKRGPLRWRVALGGTARGGVGVRSASMDLATGLGLIAGAIVLVTLILMGGDLRMFVDAHAAIVIFGGSFAATLIRF